MWHLSRVHLRGVGHDDARFDPLELDLTYAGEPCDTVWWLENGGGKTSLLSLVFAVLRPATREFLGAGHKRSLADYVGTGDVAHIALEWQLPAAGLPGINEDERLITGLTLEWPDLRAQPGNTSGLNRTQWGFRATGDYGLDQLPFLDERGRPRRARGFAEQLVRDLGPTAAAQLHRPDGNQSSWHEWLTDKDLDPEVFRFQLAMNHDEGAIAEEFSFASGDAFVEWALRVAADPELPGKVANTLEAVADRIHQQPQLELELELCDGAASRLDTLADAHGRHEAAEAAAGRAREEAAELAAAIERAAADAAAAIESATGEKEAAEKAANRANTDATRATRLANRWRQLAADAQVRDADTDVTERTAAAEIAGDTATAWRATDLLLDHDRLSGDRDRAREELDRFEEGLAPLKAQLAASEAELTARAAHVAAAIDRRAAAVDTEVAQLRRDASEDERAAAGIARETSDAQQQAADARSELARITRAHDGAVAAGLIASHDDPPAAAAAAATTADAAAAALDEALALREVAEASVRDAEEAVNELQAPAAAAKSAAEAAAGRLAEMDQAAGKLATDELLVAATQTSPAEVWTQPGVTVDRLRQLADEARRSQVDATLHATEIDRILTGLEIDGYAPPSPDVATALERLRDAGIPAVAGFTYLTQAVADGQRREVLTAAPDVAAGVVVTDPDTLARAYDTLGGLVPSAPLTISTAAALSQPQPTGGRYVLPPDPAVYDPAAAAALLARLTGERATTDATIERAQQRIATLESATARFEALHERWPDPHQVRQAATDTAEARSQAEASLAGAVETRRQAWATRDAARDAVPPLEEELTAARERHRKLDDLAGQWAARDGFQQTLAAATRTLERLTGEQAALNERADARNARQLELAAEAERLTSQRSVTADQLARLSLAPVDASGVDDPGGTLEAHEHTVTGLRGRLRAARTEEGLAAKLEELDRQISAVAGKLADLDPGVTDRARQLLAGPDGQTPAARRHAAAAADAAVTACSEQLGEAKVVLRDARRAVDAAAALDTVELPEGTVVPAAATARQQHAERETERGNELWKQRREYDRRAVEHDRRATAENERRQLLAQSVHHLTDALADVALPAAAAGYPGTAEQADGDARRLLAAIAAAAAAESESVKDRQAAHHALVQYVRRETFAPLVGDGQPTSKVVSRLTVDDVEAIAGDAETVHDDLVRRAAGIRQDLADVDVHRQLLIDQLVGVARDAVGLLSDIQARSRMPDGLAGWSKRRFIQIRHQPLPDDPAALTDRIERTVDQLVATRATPDGHQLLYRATRAAVGDRPFDIRILKPHPDLRYDRVDVTSLTSFSGGQKVTAAIALFTTMLNMRATARGKHGYRTTLLLDNPFGKSSADALVHLQRQVAARLGIQLVFTTAVKDLAALSQFRRVIRLEHRRNRISGALHVVEQQPGSRLVAAAVSRADEPAADGEPAA